MIGADTLAGSRAAPFEIAVNQPDHLPAVRVHEAPRASLARTLGAGTRPDPCPDEESRGDLSDGGKRICSAKATNILEVAVEEPRRSKSVYDAAPPQLGMPWGLRQR